MGEISFGHLVTANFWLVLVVTAFVAVVATVLIVRHRRRQRWLPTTIDGVRFECEDVRVDDDMVVERAWRATFLLTNVTNHPVPTPAIGARGIVRAGRAEFAGTAYVECLLGEVNPGDELVAWLVWRVPSDLAPSSVTITLLSSSLALTLTSRVHSELRAL